MYKTFKYILLVTLLACSPLAAQSQSIDECMDFLYASMSAPDAADYPRQFYEQNVRTTLQAHAEMPWGQSIPRREFMHFVLPIRVNNEHLDDSRMVFYAELKDRVKRLSMSDAALEVNHWCHEKVTYTPSDERTSSPLATVRTAQGRCGEESTFLVAALRAVGIPARQVYTPRWAHTDDNHAWVEAWCDGEWHFMGACEPEAVLDLGWFNAPASRGMLMHTRVWGNYDGPEEVIKRTPCFTEIDVTSNYAPVARREVKVVDTHGYPVAGATVEFKIYNYAEFYTVSTRVTDERGMTHMQAGKGDLIAWASKDGKYGMAVCSMTIAEPLIVMLEHKAGDAWASELKIVPPPERNTLPHVTEQQRELNALRLKQEDSLRNAYVATFPTTDNDYIKRSRGNHAVISEFLGKTGLKFDPAALLGVISDKDLRDVTMEVLMDAANAPKNRNLDSDTYNKYVLNPRVANEHLTPFRAHLLSRLSVREKSRLSTIGNIIKWTRDSIAIDEQSNPQHLRMTPVGVMDSRKCDRVSRNIFFVALCRTRGFAARIDPVTGKVEYLDGGSWREVKLDDDATVAASSQGTLAATYAPDAIIDNPKYYYHFTVSRLDGGSPQLLNYDDGDTWQGTLARGVKLDEGDYMITSGTRLADGSVLVHVEIAPVESGHTTTLPLVMPSNEGELRVIGQFNSENTYDDTRQGVKSILSTTGRGYYVLGVIAPNNEPTNHTLRDIAMVKEQLESLDAPIVLIFKDKDELERFNIADFPTLPAGTHMGTDIDGKIWAELNQSLHLDQPTLPVFVIADTFNRVVFVSQGYTIGLGEQLHKHLQQLR